MSSLPFGIALPFNFPFIETLHRFTVGLLDGLGEAFKIEGLQGMTLYGALWIAGAVFLLLAMVFVSNYMTIFILLVFCFSSFSLAVACVIYFNFTIHWGISFVQIPIFFAVLVVVYIWFKYNKGWLSLILIFFLSFSSLCYLIFIFPHQDQDIEQNLLSGTSLMIIGLMPILFLFIIFLALGVGYLFRYLVKNCFTPNALNDMAECCPTVMNGSWLMSCIAWEDFSSEKLPGAQSFSWVPEKNKVSNDHDFDQIRDLPTQSNHWLFWYFYFFGLAAGVVLFFICFFRQLARN